MQSYQKISCGLVFLRFSAARCSLFAPRPFTEQRQPKMEERILSEQCRAGDRRAWHALYDRYAGRLLALCIRYAGSRTEAEDLLHDAFLKIFGSFDRFTYRGSGSLRAWIERVTINLAIERLRSGNRIDLRPLDELTTRLPEPAAEAIDRIPQEELLRMVGELPDGYRTILNLYCLDGYSHREIARMLGINEKSSSSQLTRARALLAARVREYLNQER